MTGTAKTEEVEFEKIYKLEVTVIHQQTTTRHDLSDMVFKTEEAKWRAVAEECAQMHEMGRPVLVGTTSVEKIRISQRPVKPRDSTTCSTPDQRTWAGVGDYCSSRTEALTIATNMAGRGTDIILGGNAEYMARLKLEYFMPRIVEPEDEDSFGIARASGLPSGTSSSGQGFVPGKKVKTWKALRFSLPNSHGRQNSY